MKLRVLFCLTSISIAVANSWEGASGAIIYIDFVGEVTDVLDYGSRWPCLRA